MIVLLGFALIAGAGTALSPCVLPVLPALLSATGAGGRRRPLGVVLGLAATFTLTIAGLAGVVGGVGLGADPLRVLAVAVLAGFGVVLLVPGAAARLERPLAGLTRLAPRSGGDGFGSGVLVGGALGFVYTPCAGPILAAVITVGAASGRTVAVAVAYAAGSAAVLLALCVGGRRGLARVRGPVAQRAMGTVMLLTAAAIVSGIDVRFDQLVARDLPTASLTASLERSHAVTGRLGELSGRRAAPPRQAAPALAPTGRWFNSRPLTLAALRGRVVLLDFWTYTCINCLRTLPYLEAWDARYRRAGLTVIGVHTPEFAFEHDAGNVARAVRRLGVRYPVVQDNAERTWDAYGVEYWPTEVLIDAGGRVRYASAGEGDYARTEMWIRLLLAQRGDAALGHGARPRGVVTPAAAATPETYLGTDRAQGWVRGEPRPGRATYTRPVAALAPNTFALGGTWDIGGQPATAVADATIDAEVVTRRVYLVMGSDHARPRDVRVLVDGRPVRDVTVTGQRLYTLVALPRLRRFRLTLHIPAGITAYAFTFG